MMTGIMAVVIEVVLLVMKLIGASAQKRKNFLDWIAKKSAEANSSINMKESWEKIRKDLIRQLSNQS